MTETPSPKKSKKLDIINRVLIFIEKLGNKLPDPITLFFYLSVAVVIILSLIHI